LVFADAAGQQERKETEMHLQAQLATLQAAKERLDAEEAAFLQQLEVDASAEAALDQAANEKSALATAPSVDAMESSAEVATVKYVAPREQAPQAQSSAPAPLVEPASLGKLLVAAEADGTHMSAQLAEEAEVSQAVYGALAEETSRSAETAVGDDGVVARALAVTEASQVGSGLAHRELFAEQMPVATKPRPAGGLFGSALPLFDDSSAEVEQSQAGKAAVADAAACGRSLRARSTEPLDMEGPSEGQLLALPSTPDSVAAAAAVASVATTTGASSSTSCSSATALRSTRPDSSSRNSGGSHGSRGGATSGSGGAAAVAQAAVAGAVAAARVSEAAALAAAGRAAAASEAVAAAQEAIAQRQRQRQQCGAYKVDTSAAAFGQCVCGRLKAEHSPEALRHHKQTAPLPVSTTRAAHKL
jgi:hypothetical protein